MKKAVFILALLFLFACLGIFAFIATFKIDKYRPLLVNKIESAIGRGVALDKIVLSLAKGPSIEGKGFRVYASKRPEGDPIFEIDAVQARLEWKPLLRREFRVSSIRVIRPKGSIERDERGALTVALPAALPSSEVSQISSKKNLPFLLFIDSLDIEDGSICFSDALQKPPVEYCISNLDGQLADISFEGSSYFSFSADAFSQRPSLQLEGLLRLPYEGRPGSIQGFKSQLVLDHINVGELLSAFPSLKSAGIKGAIKGKIDIASDEIVLLPDVLHSLNLVLKLSGGEVNSSLLSGAITDIDCELRVKGKDIELGNFDARIAKGALKASGKIEDFLNKQKGSIKIELEGLRLEEVAAPKTVSLSEASLNGKASTLLALNFTGFDWPRMANSMSGSGRVDIKDASLVNVNVLREVFQKLSMFPGLVDRLKSRLSESYKKKLEDRDTPLMPLQIPFSVLDGALFADDILVETDTFSYTGSVRGLIDGSFNSKGFLKIDAEFSSALIRSVEELSSLSDSYGRLEIPVSISRSSGERLAVIPDLQFIASKAIINKAQDLLNDYLLRKTRASDEAATAPGAEEVGTDMPQTQ
jgi:hypothetical protein